jgi:AcrR family transcriptional regulator
LNINYPPFIDFKFIICIIKNNRILIIDIYKTWKYNEFILNEQGVNEMPESQRQKQKNETRQHIIEVALKKFAQDGLGVTRTSDIAKAANVSHGTVFSHFPTRDALLDTVIEEFGMRITNRMHELVDSNCGIKEVLEAHLKGISEYEAFYRRLVSESSSLTDSSRNSLIMIQSAISFHLSQAAESQMKEGAIRSIPTDLLFNTWIGLINYYLVNADLFAPGGSVIERHGKRLLEHYINLINLNERS